MQSGSRLEVSRAGNNDEVAQGVARVSATGPLLF